MAPWIWWASLLMMPTARPVTVFAAAMTRMASSSSAPAATTSTALSAAASAAAASPAICDRYCCSTWNLPIGLPNCSRSLQYCTDSSAAWDRAPAISNERASAPRACTCATDGPGTNDALDTVTSAHGSPA